MAYIPISGLNTTKGRTGYIPISGLSPTSTPAPAPMAAPVATQSRPAVFGAGLGPGVIGAGGVHYPDYASGYGASFRNEPISGKPLLAFDPVKRTTLPDRTAQTFDVTKPQKLENFTTKRMPKSASDAIRKEIGATTFQQLDHLMPISLGGSNDRVNLKLVDEVNGKQPLYGLEMQIWRKALKGEISVLDAWRQMAEAKGITLEEDKPKEKKKRFLQSLKEGIISTAAKTPPIRFAASIAGGTKPIDAFKSVYGMNDRKAEQSAETVRIKNELLAQGFSQDKALVEARRRVASEVSKEIALQGAMGSIGETGDISRKVLKAAVGKIIKIIKNEAAGKVTESTLQTSKALSQSGKTPILQTGQKKLSLPQVAKAQELSPQSTQILVQDARKLSSAADSSPLLTKSGSKSQGLNLSRLNVSDEGKKVIQQTVEDMKPRIEEITGKKLANQEALDLAEGSSKVLTRAIGKESTLEWEAAMLRARQDLAAAAQTGTVDRSFVENLLTIKTQAADIGRKLQSLSIKADPLEVTSKEALLDAVLQINKNVDEVTAAAKGVDFNDFRQASEFYRKFIKPTASEWLDLVRYNSMLTSPKTHIVNVFSNFVNTSIVAPIEKSLTGNLDYLGSKLTGAERKYFAGEAGAYLKGYYGSVREAARSFADVMRGKSAFTNLDTRNIPLATKGLKGGIAKTLSFPLKLLEGMDRFFMTLGRGAEEAALTLREAKGVKVPLKSIQAENSAAYRVFRQELFSADQGKVLDAIDQITNSIQRLRGNDNKLVSTIAKFTVPFLRTPMNIFKQGIEYSPFGFSTLLGAKNTTEQLSKAILGSAVFAGAATLLTSGRLTWAEPINTQEKNDFRAAGKQSYSVKIGDKWYSYQKLAPGIAFPISFVAMLDDLAKNREVDDNLVDVALTGIAKYGEFLADQSYAKSIGDLLNAAKGGEAGITRVVSNNIQQLIPFRALTGWVTRLFDESQRKVDTQASFIEQQIQQLMLQYPGLSQNVPARLDSKGNPVSANSRVLNAFSPINITKENQAFAEFLDKKFEVKSEIGKASEQRSDKKEAFTSKYEEIKSLVESGQIDEAKSALDSLSDEEYEAYKSLKSSDTKRNNLDLEVKIYPTFQEIRALVDAGKTEEAKTMLDALDDDQYEAYKRLKNKLTP